ncbi:ABC transporter permease [Aestuariirhabdus sp. LZHN29]|uniref:ABC transporter permease n=1 Tax=Aestuariirhabdus sp. LZHN29 TaxID=3417462 RepID=UPI003CF6D43D
MRKTKSHMLEVFFAKLVFNLKSETKKTHLRYIWWILEPALFVAVFYLVFSVFLNRGTEDFLVFLLCGKIPFLWFSKSVANSSNSIVAGKGLIHQIKIPKPFFPLLVVAQDFVKQLFVFGFFFVFLVCYGVEITGNWLYMAPVIITQLLLIIACALFAAAVTPFIPDFKFIISTGMMLLMFGSGIFYSYKEMLDERHQELFLMNPLADLIKNYRDVLLGNMPPDMQSLSTISVVSVLVIVVMGVWFSKKDTVYARVVIQ